MDGKHSSSLKVIVFINLFMQIVSGGDFFSSSAKITDLVRMEELAIPILQKALEKAPHPLPVITRILETFLAHRDNLEEFGYISAAEHPIDVLLTVKHWAQLNHLSHVNETWMPVKEELASLRMRFFYPLPQYIDYKEALGGLWHLMATFKIPTNDIISGEIYGFKSRVQFETDDIYSLAMYIKDYNRTVALQLLGHLIEMSQSSSGWVSLAEIYLALSKVYREAEKYEIAFDMAQEALRYGNNSSRVIQNYFEMKEIARAQILYATEHIKITQNGNLYFTTGTSSILEDAAPSHAYASLCRGDGKRNDIRIIKELSCQYRKGHGLAYNVYKEEIHYLDPRISIFLDVISESEAQSMSSHLPSLSMPTLETEEFITPDITLSKASWLYDSRNDVTARLSKRIQDITGLHTASADGIACSEPFKVINDGVGGVLEPLADQNMENTDHFKSTVSGSPADRMATFTYYMSDVFAGGATIFPSLSVHLPVIKNGAAFWYNERVQGGLDDRTKHIACPVLLGKKLVSTKAIRRRCQDTEAICSKTDDLFDTFAK